MTTHIVLGTVVTYTLTYRNIGNTTALGVFIVDTVPTQTTFVAQASTPGWNCPDAAPAGTACTFTIGDLIPNQQGSVIFAIRIDVDVLVDTQILNVASIITLTDPLEVNVANNNSAALLVVERPTDENSGKEPKNPLPFRIFLPKVER